MLRSLTENQLSANFLIIEDREDVCCEDLFIAFILNFKLDNPKTKINLICFENPPGFYLLEEKLTDKNIICYDYFSDPVGWKNPTTSKTDLSVFTSLNSEDLSESVFFIDSVSLLAHYHGFCAAYRNLNFLAKFSKKVVCVAHGDVLVPEQLEELYFLATAVIKIGNVSNKQNCDERTAEVLYKKPGGKVIKEEEIFNVYENFKIDSIVKGTKNLSFHKDKHEKPNMESFTTFNLGIHLSEVEKKAKEELVLPYVKTQEQNIIYQPDIDEMEDDPDDDLDI